MIKKFKVLKRAKDISIQLSKLGFYNIYEYFKLLLGLEVDKSVKPQKIRETLEALGPSFIKLGQVLSTRPDILPEEVIIELTKLQDRAPEVEFDKIEQLLNKNFGNYKNVFEYINPKPVASASVSQVHEGFLLTGEKVAVKVKRPNIEEIIKLDIAFFQWLFSFLEKHSKTAKELNLKAIIEEYKRTIRKEINFEIEAYYLDTFRKNFKKSETFYIPKRFKKYCTKDVLVLEFIEGIKISQIDELKNRGFSLKDIAENLTDAYFKMVFEDGIYHADPHPGNLFVMYNGKIACLDFGMVGRLPSLYKKLLYEHIYAVLNFDVVLAMNFYEGLEMITPKTDLNKLENDVMDFLEKYYNKKLEEIDLKELVLDVLYNIIKANHLRLPSELAYLGKTALNLEGTVRKIYPSYNPTERLKFHLKKGLKDYLKEKTKDLKQIGILAYNVPFKIENIYRKLNTEKLTISLISKDLEQKADIFKRQINKVVIALIVVSMFISSSIMYLAKESFYGNTFLILAIILTFILTIKIFKE